MKVVEQERQNKDQEAAHAAAAACGDGGENGNNGFVDICDNEKEPSSSTNSQLETSNGRYSTVYAAATSEIIFQTQLQQHLDHQQTDLPWWSVDGEIGSML